MIYIAPAPVPLKRDEGCSMSLQFLPRIRIRHPFRSGEKPVASFSPPPIAVTVSVGVQFTEAHFHEVFEKHTRRGHVINEARL